MIDFRNCKGYANLTSAAQPLITTTAFFIYSGDFRFLKINVKLYQNLTKNNKYLEYILYFRQISNVVIGSFVIDWWGGWIMRVKINLNDQIRAPINLPFFLLPLLRKCVSISIHVSSIKCYNNLQHCIPSTGSISFSFYQNNLELLTFVIGIKQNQICEEN